MLILITIATVYCVYPLSARRGSSRNEKPEWLVNPQSHYPETQYLVAIGEGDSRRRAEANASNNLARIFETKVQAEELFTERYQEIVSGDSFEASIAAEIHSSINLSTDQTLYNIQYADSYTDNMGRVYVLAYIHRLRTAYIYLDMINKHADQINQLLQKFAETENNLLRYAYLSSASVISTANEVLLEQLNIIAGHYTDMLDLTYNHSELKLKTRDTASQLSFKINIENDIDNKIKSVLSDMLTEEGFAVSDNGDIPLSGEIMIEDVELPRPENFVRWNLTLNLSNTYGSNIVTHSQRGREGHVTRSEAIARAFRAIEREIRSEFKGKLFNHFDTLASSSN